MRPLIKIIHIIDSLTADNHGIVEAALSTSKVLASDFGIDSELWYSKSGADLKHRFDLRCATRVGLSTKEIRSPVKFLKRQNASLDRTVIVTHGCWRFPTRIGYQLSRNGFAWVYVPHGMLEPWSLAQKSLFKKLYWNLCEQRFARHANIVRATAETEAENLRALSLENTRLISHGITLPKDFEPDQRMRKIRILFMGRFHPKKNASTLAKAWKKSDLYNDENFELIFIGTDDGDFKRLKAELKNCETANLTLRAPIYGNDKAEFLKSCQFFILPSESEGFPVALLECMAAGLIPIISSGCNFPKVINSGLAIPVSTDVDSIVTGLNSIVHFSPAETLKRRAESRRFVFDDYSVGIIAAKQAEMYRSLLI